MASAALAQSCFEELNRADSSFAGIVPILEAADVIKRETPDGLVRTVGRASMGAAQVPMAFDRATLDRAHQALVDHERGDVPSPDLASDPPVEDSHLLEILGFPVGAVRGEVTNVHVVDGPSLDLIRAIADSETDPAI